MASKETEFFSPVTSSSVVKLPARLVVVLPKRGTFSFAFCFDGRLSRLLLRVLELRLLQSYSDSLQVASERLALRLLSRFRKVVTAELQRSGGVPPTCSQLKSDSFSLQPCLRNQRFPRRLRSYKCTFRLCRKLPEKWASGTRCPLRSWRPLQVPFPKRDETSLRRPTSWTFPTPFRSFRSVLKHAQELL